MLKGIFLEVKKKFETALSVLRQEKITIDPDDHAAVQQYAKVMKTVREKYIYVTLSSLCYSFLTFHTLLKLGPFHFCSINSFKLGLLKVF